MTIRTSLISIYYEYGVENRSGWVNFCCGIHQSFCGGWDQQCRDWRVSLVQAPLESVLWPWVLVFVRLCVCPPRVEPLIAPSYGLPAVKPCWSSKPNILGDSPDARPLGWGAWCGDQNFCNIVVLQFVGHPTIWYGNLLYKCVSPTVLLWFVFLHTHFFARCLYVCVCVHVYI